MDPRIPYISGPSHSLLDGKNAEELVYRGASAQIPLNPAVTTTPRIETPQTVKAMPVDFAAAAKQWERALQFIEHEFLAN